MREFFHGWRRKAGVVTLVMACPLMGGWIRSYAVCDVITIRCAPDRVDVVASSGGMLLWLERFDTINPRFNYVNGTPNDDDLRSIDADWEGKWLSFRIGQGLDWSVPSHILMGYWCLTVPLTLLSAYLIFWTPRKRIPSASKSDA